MNLFDYTIEFYRKSDNLNKMFLYFFLINSYSSLRASVLPRDDSYHPDVIEATKDKVYWVQNHEKASILIVSNVTTFSAQKREIGQNDFTSIKLEKSEREKGFHTLKYDLSGENPMEFKVICDSSPSGYCQYMIRNVHTEPVYRTSAVLGSFSLFICLFVLVFSWTIFCGACRATRKR